MARGPKLTAYGRRVRAALLLADRDIEDVVPELNISRKTLERTMRGERTPRDWEIRRLAEVLPIPEWFLREGLDGQPSAEDLENGLVERLQKIENLLTGLAADVAEIKHRQDGGV